MYPTHTLSLRLTGSLVVWCYTTLVEKKCVQLLRNHFLLLTSLDMNRLLAVKHWMMQYSTNLSQLRSTSQDWLITLWKKMKRIQRLLHKICAMKVLQMQETKQKSTNMFWLLDMMETHTRSRIHWVVHGDILDTLR